MQKGRFLHLLARSRCQAGRAFFASGKGGVVLSLWFKEFLDHRDPHLLGPPLHFEKVSVSVKRAESAESAESAFNRQLQALKGSYKGTTVVCASIDLCIYMLFRCGGGWCHVTGAAGPEDAPARSRKELVSGDTPTTRGDTCPTYPVNSSDFTRVYLTGSLLSRVAHTGKMSKMSKSLCVSLSDSTALPAHQCRAPHHRPASSRCTRDGLRSLAAA